MSASAEDATNAVLHPHGVHGEDDGKASGGHPRTTCRRECFKGEGGSDVDVQTDASGEEDGSKEVVVAEVRVERANGKDECREF
jgi:hypothetical protein